jgi:pyruvate formate lyase activating enzyme
MDERDDDLLPTEALVRARSASSSATETTARPKRRATDLARELATRTAPAELFTHEGGSLRCTACAHRCVMGEGRVGACGVRDARDGQIFAPFGYVARRYVREVETNTVYHVEPGAKALTFGMYGCDLRCPYCHNWKLSQALREDAPGEAPVTITPAELVDEAIVAGARVVCAAYNEPMIAAEWVKAVFTEARERGLRTMVVSDGNTTPEALAYLRPVTDVYRVDLKGFDGEQYKTLGGRLEPVLGAIAEARRLGYWVEVVTLVVPGFNDDANGLRGLAKKLAAIDPSMPWHLNAFQPRYKMAERPAMHPELLVSVAGVAFARGMRFVYVGNVTHMFGELEHTRCPGCHATVVERANYRTTKNRLTATGACPDCGERIPGLFGEAPRGSS